MNDHSMMGVVFLLLGTTILVANIGAIHATLRATHWKPIWAKVLRAFVRDNSIGRGGISVLFQRKDRAYVLEYQFAGRQYQWTSDPDWLIPTDLSEGARVQLFVNPKNPVEVVYAPGLRIQYLLNLFPALALIGSGLFFLFGIS